MKKITVLLLIIFILGGCNPSGEQLATIGIDENNLTIEVDEIKELSISYTQGFVLKAESMDEEIASVDGLFIIGIKEGQTTVRYYLEGTDAEKIIQVEVVLTPTEQLVITGPDVVYINQEVQFEISPDEEDISWAVEPATHASISDEGLLQPLTKGNITVTAHKSGYFPASLTVVITDAITNLVIEGPGMAFVNETVSYAVGMEPAAATANFIWESSDSETAEVIEGGIHFKKEGLVEIRARMVENEEILVSKQIVVYADEEDAYAQILVDQNMETDVVNEDERYYILGTNAFNDVTSAINHAKVNTTIILASGIYSSDIYLNKGNIALVGPNRNIDPNQETRNEEAIIESTIRVSIGLTNIQIDGLAFTNQGKVIVLGSTQQFEFKNNYIYDTTVNAKVWTEEDQYRDGVVAFNETTTFSDQVLISHNRFERIGDVGVNYSNMNTIKFLNNEFVDFEKDAIRSSKGIVNKTSQWLFMDNKFVNGQYNGIFFRTYGSNNENNAHFISIYNNTFQNVGKTEVAYSGAVSFRNYQEGETSINISYNEFKECKNYLFLRNNAVSANQNRYSAYVTYNAFLGEPTQYYMKNKNSTDSSTTNPSQAKWSHNFYGSINQTALLLSSIQNKFSGNAANDFPLAEYDELQGIVPVYGSNTAYMGTGSNLIIPDGAAVQINDSSILTIDATGKITPLKEGSTQIVITSEDKTTVMEIRVKPSLSINYIKRLLETAIAEEGYKEGPNNDTKYGTWYGIPNAAWCAMFVTWSANRAGISTNVIPRYASVSLGMQWFIDQGRFEYKQGYVPKAGDLIFFKSDGASHTGIVISSDGTKVYTIEGNTSDMVAKRSYDLGYSKITGYGLPNYPVYEGEDFVFDVSDATDGSSSSTK
ncbi:MAG: CHAP domain-containing protein [Bacilli bacterium]|nr:CHAP domain-containing protein [Bacilli bacterium]